MLPEVTNLDDWVAVSELVNWEILTIQLVGVSWFDVPSMVLVEVIKLIVDINWTFNFFFYWVQWNITELIILLQFGLAFRILVVLGGTFENLFAEHIKYYTDSKEDDTKDTEGEHGTHGGWDRTPCWEGLLFKLGLLKLLDLFTDPLLLIWIDVHFFFKFNQIIIEKYHLILVKIYRLVWSTP